MRYRPSTSLVLWHGIDFPFLSPFVIFCLQEKTSTSQAGRRRGPCHDMPSASSIISSLSMEELRSYCQIPNNIDFELSDGPTKPTLDEEDNIVYFNREQLTAHSRAPLPHFISGKAVSTLHWSSAYSYPSECHSDPDWV